MVQQDSMLANYLEGSIRKKYRYIFSAVIKYFSDLKIFEKDRLWCKHLKILQNPNIPSALTLEYAL